MDHSDHPDNAPDIANGLGELPFDVRRERRETYEQEVIPQGPPGIMTEIPGQPAGEIIEPPILLPSPTDVRGQNAALVDASNAPFGLPAVNFLVQTTFDARPINGRDWRFESNVLLDPVGEGFIEHQVTFIVPKGRIAILRDLEWFASQIIPQTLASSDNDISATQPFFVQLAVAGAIELTYEQMFRQESHETVYTIAQENELIVVTVRANSNYNGSFVGYSPQVIIKMHGNLLDSRGREKQYEPANEYQGDILK